MADDGGVRTLLAGHGHVSAAIVEKPQARVRDLVVDAGPAERATRVIVTGLEGAGYVTRRRAGRRAGYTVQGERRFRHHCQDGLVIAPFLPLPAAVGDSRMPP